MEETLLPGRRRRRSPECKEDEDEEERSSVSEEVKRQLWLTGPLMAGYQMQNLVQTISTMFLGHLGELPLAGASIAGSFTTVTGFSLLYGLASALDTFYGQAFGARQYHLVCIYKQRAMLILTLMSVSSTCKHTWTGFSMEAFRGARDFFRLAVPAALMVR
uniref:Uncharacterized protein n=1 Tax=Avena sativa TaxID=4498 RepID=A0ACD5VA87_AVESA